MLIDKTEIERVKQTTDLVTFIRDRGIKLTRKGKQLVGLCIFHKDSDPSLIVDPVKQLWNCLGACNEGGDIYRFVMKADGVDFPEAHRRLGGGKEEEPEKRRTGESEKEPVRSDDLQWLQRAAEHYHQVFLQTPKAQDYAHSRGLVAPELATTFRVGYANGSLLKKLSPEGKQSLKRIGLLTGSGIELMRGCLIFPLVTASGNQIVSLYGRHTEHRQHLYLPGERRGLFNPQGALNTDEVIITESVIDAAALWSIGIRNVIPAYGTNGLTDEIISHLQESRTRRVVLMLDSDDAGRTATQAMSARLKETGISARAVELPAKDAAEFIADSGSALEQVRALIDASAVVVSQSAESTAPAEPIETIKETTAPQVESNTDGVITITLDKREYRIRGLLPTGLDRLKVNIRLKVATAFHIDTLDLYQSRARKLFAETAARACRVEEATISADLLQLVEQLESKRLELRHTDQESKVGPLTPTEHAAALEFLKSPNLCERIADDFRACGFIGERATVLTSYLAAVSRKLSKPLSVLVLARSGAGKSSLQDALCAFTPPEDLVRVTRLTGQALFYKDSDSLKYKVLAIAEVEGAQAASYSLRTLVSDQYLSTAATRTDPQTGKLHTEHYELHGPVSVITTTTSAEAFDEETRNRFVQLSLNESREQTQAILQQQRQAHTLAGLLQQSTTEHVRKLHQNAQRLLRPLHVLNPYVQQLGYPADRLISRREHEKYMTLINAIALLHQHQRQLKHAVNDRIEIEYIEVTPSDIALANELAKEVLWRSFDELAAPVRAMLGELKALFSQRAEESKTPLADVGVMRREIRQVTGWSDWQVRVYCQKLVDLEYLYLTQSSNGKPSLYKLALPLDEPTPEIAGLTDVAIG